MSINELVVRRPGLGTFQPGPSSSLLSMSSAEDVSSMREILDLQKSSFQLDTAEIKKLSLASKPVALVTGFRKESTCYGKSDIILAANLQGENEACTPDTGEGVSSSDGLNRHALPSKSSSSDPCPGTSASSDTSSSSSFAHTTKAGRKERHVDIRASMVTPARNTYAESLIDSTASLRRMPKKKRPAPPAPPRRYPLPPKYTYASCTSLNSLGSRLSWSASSTSAHTTPCAARKGTMATPTAMTAVKTLSQTSLLLAHQTPTVAPPVTTRALHKKRPAPPAPVSIRRELQAARLKAIQAETRDIERKEVILELRGRNIAMRLKQLSTCRSAGQLATLSVDGNSEEDLMMELVELLNEKNALFRRQTELMYMKKYHRLEEEQIELDYQIRLLINKPASQRTPEDEERESALIHKLVEVVELRNEVVDAQEMDRRRFGKEEKDSKTFRALFMNKNAHGTSLLASNDRKSSNTENDKNDKNGKTEESKDDKLTHENVKEKSSKKTLKTIFMERYKTLMHGSTTLKKTSLTNVNDELGTELVMVYTKREYL